MARLSYYLGAGTQMPKTKGEGHSTSRLYCNLDLLSGKTTGDPGNKLWGVTRLIQFVPINYICFVKNQTEVQGLGGEEGGETEVGM